MNEETIEVRDGDGQFVRRLAARCPRCCDTGQYVDRAGIVCACLCAGIPPMNPAPEGA